jgi:N-acetylglucosamine PTS system EIICBA or EIICB component
MKNSQTSSMLHKLVKNLLILVAVLPIAGIIYGLGQTNVLNIPWMVSAGNAVFANLPLLLAFTIAIGIAEENNGVAGLAAVVGFYVLNYVAKSFDKTIDMNFFGGIVSGLIAGLLYNKYKAIRVPSALGFFGGKRFVPIVTSFAALILGIIAGYGWPIIQKMF